MAEGRGAGADGRRYMYVCVRGGKKRNGGLFSSLTGQLQHLTDLPLKLEITSASYGNCLVCLLSHYPTQREDACLLKGLERDVYISSAHPVSRPALNWAFGDCLEVKKLEPSAATGLNSQIHPWASSATWLLRTSGKREINVSVCE